MSIEVMDKSGTGQWGSWRFEVLHPDAKFLNGTAAREHSQFGEEGVLEALFAHIGETNRWCFECGAADGLFCSNTKRLRDQGWSAVLIEADDEQFDKLTAHASDKVHCYRQLVVGDDIDRLLARAGAPRDLDLGIVDVDGQDWHLWKAMTVYQPRVMLVEYSGSQDSIVPPQGAAFGQAGLKAIRQLGEEKGYVLLATTLVNALFCDRRVWEGILHGTREG